MRVAVDNRDNPTGIVAVRTLLNGEENSLIEDFLLGGDVVRAMQTVEVLANSQDGRAHPLLVRVIEDPDQPWPLREHAVRLLAGSRFGLGALLELAKLDRFPEDLLEVAGTSLTRTMNVRLREEAEQFFPVPPLADGKAIPQMTELLVYVGDPDRGKEVFEKAECGTCHLIEGTGTEFGPDLSRIGEKLPKAGLYEAILDPSAGIASNYRLFYFTLRDGREVSGFILGETPDKLTLRLEGGVLSEYSSSDLISRRESSVSAMPSDLQRQISVDELVDLVEYLTTQQSIVGSEVSQ
jgi:putative heme-binding domain-containing protein